MQIRDRLTLSFTAIVAVILLFFCFSIYHLVYLNSENIFENRLRERALNTAKMLLEVDEINEDLLKALRRRYLQALPHECVRIYDQNFNIVYKDDTTNLVLSKNELRQVIKDDEITLVNEPRMTVGIKYAGDNQNYIIVASAIDKYGRNKLNNLFWVLTGGYFVCLIIILISGRMFAIQALRPISRIITQVEQISGSNLSTRLQAGKEKDEMSQLASTFNRMFERVENAFDMQKRFVSNVSHELRTPLTSIRGEIEVTLMKDRSKSEYKEALESVLEETTKLTKLSNGLLELAHTGIDAANLKISSINIDHIVERITEETIKRHPDGILKIDYSPMFQDYEVFINGNEELLITAFKNVISNSFKYSIERIVEFKIFKANNGVVFSIKDFGIGISQKELNQVFEPFYRSANVNNIPGHGIGLPLTEKIVRLHHGEITIESEEGKGTMVSITLPIAS